METLPKHTKMQEAKIIVSICCITYNQASCIHRALDGFLMQETNFAFEILIHDDASTDDTPNIIKEYVEKYPKIIKPIYQKENQYSKGIRIWSTHLFPIAQGNYIALCEGDDYWTDSLKLQKQVDLLEEYPDINLCFHKTFLKEDSVISKSQRDDWLYPKTNSIIETKAIIALDGDYIPTASIVFRSKSINELSAMLKDKPVGDFFLQIFTSHPNGALFINEYLSCYTLLGAGSWGETHNKKSISEKIEFVNALHYGVMDMTAKWSDSEKYLGAIRFLYISQIIRTVSCYRKDIKSLKEAYTKILPLGRKHFSYFNSNKNIIRVIFKIQRFIYKIKFKYYIKRHTKRID